ncbi:DUF885 domain-containing protein [Paraglaciecola sp.]|uniref:DUF885 domain-containing protein n=1 Tax=Paraglaciecola sp. TaxID=1920173 RepID=UPI003EF273F7
MKSFVSSLLLMFVLLSSNNSIAKDQIAQIKALADKYSEVTFTFSQPYAYFEDIKLKRHNLFLKNSLESFATLAKVEDEILQTLNQIDVNKLEENQARIFYAKFKESLETSVELRVCKSELWDLSHMFGPHSILDFLVNVQPLETKQNLDDALERWQDAASYYDQEIINLSLGLKQGYSAPKRVVKRLISQLDGLTSSPVDAHPFLKLASRTDDLTFKSAFKEVLDKELIPAIKRYSSFLNDTYIKDARSELGIHVLPKGKACYMAKYRYYTTLKRTPQQVFDLGLKTVNGNKDKVIELGKKYYDVDSFSGAVNKASNDPSQKFSSPEEMHQFFESVVKRSKIKITDYFHRLPSIEMVVEAIPEYQRGTGRSAHYISGTADRTAKFAYDPTNYQKENFASGERVSVHEGYPGHHLQIALVHEQAKFHEIEGLFSNSAFAEGWARYAEMLSEEANIYQFDSTKILRRAWPARGMVADTAMHMLGWSNEKVSAFLKDSGASFARDPDTILDRMAAMPAQLTAYDSGALEIFALRKLMQSKLGEKFDIKDFHGLILKNGNVPLSVLNEQVMEFLMEKRSL